MTDATAHQPTDVKRLLRILRRRGWLLVLCAIVAAAVTLVHVRGEHKQYTASATLLFRASQLDQKLFGTSFSAPTQDPQAEQATNVALLGLPVVARLTASALGPPATPREVTSAVTTSAVSGGDLATVAATSPIPAEAATIANAYAHAFVTYRQTAERAQVDAAAALIQRQRSALSGSSPANLRLSLNDRIAQLRILAALQTGDVQVAQAAVAPPSPSGPRVGRDTALAFILGLLVGIIALLLTERLNRRLVEQDELEETFGLPVLGVVPSSRTIKKSRTARLPPAESEAFRLLYARIRYFNVDRAIGSLLVTSPSSSDGKSTVAWNLARAAAEVNPPDSVLLLEADLRRPVLEQAIDVSTASEFGREAGPAGLAEVLGMGIDPGTAIRRIALETPFGPAETTLCVMTAGSPPPNPSQLLESQRMNELLDQLRSQFSLIIIDSPPPSLVSDGLALIRQISGVVIVGRLGHTRRDAVRSLMRELTRMDAPLLGVVVNDAATVPGYGYSSPTVTPEAGVAA